MAEINQIWRPKKIPIGDEHKEQREIQEYNDLLFAESGRLVMYYILYEMCQMARNIVLQNFQVLKNSNYRH